MNWFLIVINLNGGQPAFMPMESEHACMMARAAIYAQDAENPEAEVSAYCINAIEA